jgi:hypothetical protein
VHTRLTLSVASARAALWGALWAALWLTLALPTVAQEDLYGPQAPSDVAFVRAVNARDPGGLGVRVGDAELEALAYGGATGYVAVAPGLVRIDLGGEEHEVDVERGTFLTAVAHPGGAWFIEDTPLRDVSRGMLSLYNLTDDPGVDLVVVDGPMVFEAVEPGTHAAVAIAEAEVALRVVGSKGQPVELEALRYERGVAHSLLALPGPEGLVVAYVASRADP